MASYYSVLAPRVNYQTLHCHHRERDIQNRSKHRINLLNTKILRAAADQLSLLGLPIVGEGYQTENGMVTMWSTTFFRDRRSSRIDTKVESIPNIFFRIPLDKLKFRNSSSPWLTRKPLTARISWLFEFFYSLLCHTHLPLRSLSLPPSPSPSLSLYRF